MPPFILGLTGSIGMGKSATSEMLRDLGIPVLDSDQVVHDLYSAGGAAVQAVEAAFPGVIDPVTGGICRPLLSKYVVGNPEALQRLENIVHPLVREEKTKFMTTTAAASAMKKTGLVVLDIPLLYETGAEADCDAVAVVSAPADIQRARVLARPGMTLEKLDNILQRQLPDVEKRKKADFVIDTGVSIEETRQHVEALVKALEGRQGKVYLRYIE
jgi:dephospho-CoA kinase